MEQLQLFWQATRSGNFLQTKSWRNTAVYSHSLKKKKAPAMPGFARRQPFFPFRIFPRRPFSPYLLGALCLPPLQPPDRCSFIPTIAAWRLLRYKMQAWYHCHGPVPLLSPSVRMFSTPPATRTARNGQRVWVYLIFISFLKNYLYRRRDALLDRERAKQVVRPPQSLNSLQDIVDGSHSNCQILNIMDRTGRAMFVLFML